MRKTVVVLLILCLMIISLSAFAAKECRGAGDRAYEQAGQESEFHRASDWVATREKSEKETKAIRDEHKIEGGSIRNRIKPERPEEDMPGKGTKARKKAKRKGRS